MFPNVSSQPVRRSALESAHAAFGARWIGPVSRWPSDYGDPARETETVRAAAGLAEIGDVAKLAIRGGGSSAALARAGFQFRPGEVASGSGPANVAQVWQVWGLAPDEALLVRPGPSSPSMRVDGTGVAIVDVSAGLSMFRLAGNRADGVLSELCAIDLDPRAFPDRRVVQMPLANVRVTLARLDRAGNRCFDILVPREYAVYLWEALLQNGKAHGLAPVGPAAAENGAGQ